MLRPRRQPRSELPAGDPASTSTAATLRTSATCKVRGCGRPLADEKRFYQRAGCCKDHAFALTVVLAADAPAKRFCQQCCCFHELGAFDDDKRSCRRRLNAHNNRRQQQNRVFGFHRRRRISGKPRAADAAAPAAAQADEQQADAVQPQDHAKAHATSERSNSGSDADGSGGGGSSGDLPGAAAANDGGDNAGDAVEPAPGELPASASPPADPACDTADAATRQHPGKSASLPCLLLASRNAKSGHGPRAYKRQSSAGDAASPAAAAAAVVPPSKRFCSQSVPNADQYWGRQAACELPLPPPLPDIPASAHVPGWPLEPLQYGSLATGGRLGAGCHDGGGGVAFDAEIMVGCWRSVSAPSPGPACHIRGGHMDVAGGPCGFGGTAAPQQGFIGEDAACCGDLPPGWQPPTLLPPPAAAADPTAAQLSHLAGTMLMHPRPPSRTSAQPQWQQGCARSPPAHDFLHPASGAPRRPRGVTCRSMPAVGRPGVEPAAAGQPPAWQHSLQRLSTPELQHPRSSAPGLPGSVALVGHVLEATHDWEAAQVLHPPMDQLQQWQGSVGRGQTPLASDNPMPPHAQATPWDACGGYWQHGGGGGGGGVGVAAAAAPPAADMQIASAAWQPQPWLPPAVGLCGMY